MKALDENMKVLDLFCGAGGLSIGFKYEGFAVTGADINPHAKDIFHLNEIGNFIQIDLHETSVIGAYDILIGGPPCRPWSCINIQKRGVLHPDYNLLERYFDHVLALRPRAFLLENVPPMERDASFQRFIKRAFKEGYSVEYRKIKYLNYGAATRRQRLITVGFRDFGLDAREFFDRLDQLKEDPLTVGQAIQKYEGYAANEIPDHEWPELKTIEKYEKYYETGKYGWYKLDYSKFSPSFGNIMKTYILHPRAGVDGFPLRVISVREAMEIMGFPSTFRFPPETGMGKKYQMVANSVSPVVARKMARVIKNMIRDQKTYIGQ